MEIRYVPDAPATWLVYDLGTVVLALPTEFRAVADAIAAMPRTGVTGVVAALEASGIAAAAPFAALEADAAGLHVALRGPATLAAGAETLTGLGVTTPLDRRIAGVAVARLSIPGGEWMLTFDDAAPAPVPTALRSSEEVTEIPDLEISVPPLPAPPTLGLIEVPASISEADDRTVLASELPAVPGLPVVSEPAPAVATPAPAPAPGDDKTVVVEEIQRLRAKRSSGLKPPVGVPLPAPAETPPPPGPALSLELPDGSRERLDAVVILGRAPAVPADGRPGRVVRLTGDGDISRTHARVAVEGDTVVVTDLGSRNGTIVRIPGRAPQKLRGNEPTPVLVGTVIDFGGGVELRVRED